MHEWETSDAKAERLVDERQMHALVNNGGLRVLYCPSHQERRTDRWEMV